MSAVPLNVILCSQSPERLNLLKKIGLNPKVIVSGFEENLSSLLPPHQFVIETAKGKLEAVAQSIEKEETRYDVLIAADTVIVFDGQIIGKPKDEQDAMETLNRLSGTSHQVLTGVALLFNNGKRSSFHVSTTVHFRTLPKETIHSYVQSGEATGKAGSYGIQGKAGLFVKGIDGCYSNIVGLPLGRLAQELEDNNFILL